MTEICALLGISSAQPEHPLTGPSTQREDFFTWPSAQREDFLAWSSSQREDPLTGRSAHQKDYNTGSIYYTQRELRIDLAVLSKGAAAGAISLARRCT